MNTCINCGDITLALNSSAIDMDNGLATFGHVSTLINDFCNSSSLEGELWLNVKEKLQEYIVSITNGVTVISEFMMVVKEELTKLKNSIGDFADTIDISQEQEICDLIQTIKGDIAELTYSLSKSTIMPIHENNTNGENDGNTDGQQTFDPGFANNLRKQIRELELQLSEAQKTYELIVKVKLAYENAKKQIEAAYLKVSEYVDKGIIQPDGKYIYNNS